MAFDLDTLTWRLVHENVDTGARYFKCAEVANLVKAEMKCPCCADIMKAYKVGDEQFDEDIVAASVEFALGPTLTKQ